MGEISKTTAIIIARGGSSRLPNKNLQRFNNRTLVGHKVWQLKQCALIDEVVVGTDSEAISAAAQVEGAITMRRADEFCDEKSRPWNDVIVDMVSRVECSTVVWAHCTNPCIQPATYDRAVRCFQSTDGDSLVSVTPFHNHVWWNGRPLNFDPYGTEHVVAAKLPPVYFQNGGIFIASRENMLKWRYVYGRCPEMFQIEPDEATDIDTFEDLAHAVSIYRRDER